MKQPELGRKIAEIRNAKGLTQEELVEKCNISIRTIQRIEAGEVTPRSYTVNAIFGALDYQPGTVQEKENENWIPSWLGELLLLDPALTEKKSDYLITQLNKAWFFGIGYFVLSFLEGSVEYVRYTEDVLLISPAIYLVLKVLLLFSFIFFQRGFIVLGGLFNNHLLKLISVVLMGVHILLLGYDVASFFYDSIEQEFMMIGASLLIGATGIVFGISLAALRKPLGRMAIWAAGLEVIAGGFFLTVVLFFIGELFLIPAELLRIIILYKAVAILKAEKTELCFA